MDSVSPGRRNKTVIRDKPRDGQAERGGLRRRPFRNRQLVERCCHSRLGIATGVSPEKNSAPLKRWGKKVLPDPSIDENAVTRGDFDSDRATGGSSGAARKSKAAKSEAAKRDAAETIEGSTNKKSVPPGRGRMKGRAVSPKLKSPDVHLELMRSLHPEPPRHGSAPTPALFLPSGVRYVRHTGRSLCSVWQHRSWQQRLPAKFDAAKRYTADAREESTGMTTVLHPRGEKEGRSGPTQDAVPWRFRLQRPY